MSEKYKPGRDGEPEPRHATPEELYETSDERRRRIELEQRSGNFMGQHTISGVHRRPNL